MSRNKYPKKHMNGSLSSHHSSIPTKGECHTWDECTSNDNDGDVPCMVESSASSGTCTATNEFGIGIFPLSRQNEDHL